MIENTFGYYQTQARSTAIYPSGEFLGIVYCSLKLNGEAGEVADKVGQILRDNTNLGLGPNGMFTDTFKLDIALELGDCLWYVTNLAHECGFTLQEIADMNLRKLADRKERGVLKGSGDHR